MGSAEVAVSNLRPKGGVQVYKRDRDSNSSEGVSVVAIYGHSHRRLKLSDDVPMGTPLNNTVARKAPSALENS